MGFEIGHAEILHVHVNVELDLTSNPLIGLKE